VAIVLYPHFKLKYMKFCFSKLYDVEKAQLLTKNDKKNILVSLYDFYLKVNGVKNDMNNGRTFTRHQNMMLMLVITWR